MSEQFFRGFINSVLNSRGVVSRDPRSGGDAERQLVDRFQQLAEAVRTASPKLARAFLDVARHYEADAQCEDNMAQRLRLGR